MFLEKIYIENFKGIKKLEINFTKFTKIIGLNASCKTSIYHAYFWLMFDKIFEGITETSKFGIKPAGKTNVEITVEAIFRNFDPATGQEANAEFSFKKVYREKWTKKNGTTESKCTGNENIYYIDGFPANEKAYNEIITKIISEENFKILTSPIYFSSLNWKIQRKIIMGIFKDNLEIPELLRNHTEDEVIKKLKNDMKKMNEELKTLPLLIAEIQKMMDIQDSGKIDLTEEEIKILISELKSQREEYVKSNQDIGKNEFSEKQKIVDAISLKRKQIAIQENKVIMQKTYDENIKLLNELFSEYESQKKLVFEMDINDTKCKACKQELPADFKEKKFVKLKSDWERENNKKVEELKNKGVKLKAETKEIMSKLETILTIDTTEIQNEINLLEKTFQEYSSNKQYIVNNDKIRDLDSELMLQHERLARYKATSEAKKRKDELLEREKTLGMQYINVEKQLNEVEEYIRNKVELTQKELKNIFPEEISFKAYEIQVNGGLKECFEMTYKGIPWKDLNTGHKIIAGIQIIDVISKIYKKDVPIFIDNYESLTSDIASNKQIIALIADDKYDGKKLKKGELRTHNAYLEAKEIYHIIEKR